MLASTCRMTVRLRSNDRMTKSFGRASASRRAFLTRYFSMSATATCTSGPVPSQPLRRPRGQSRNVWRTRHDHRRRGVGTGRQRRRRTWHRAQLALAPRRHHHIGRTRADGGDQVSICFEEHYEPWETVARLSCGRPCACQSRRRATSPEALCAQQCRQVSRRFTL